MTPPGDGSNILLTTAETLKALEAMTHLALCKRDKYRGYVHTKARSETALAYLPNRRLRPAGRMSSVAYAPFRTREVKAQFLLARESERFCHLKRRRGVLVLVVGDQGVLFHRKRQGLWADRVHRKDVRALAIVS